MKNKSLFLIGNAVILMSILACNISKAGPEEPASTDLPPEPPVEQDLPGGLHTLTLQAGSGYLFDTAEIVVGSNDRDIWWNRIELVPENRMGSLGILDDISQIDQAAGWILESKPFVPAVGEAFLVEVTAETEYAILRVLSFGGEGEISFEYMFPFEGAVLP